MYILYIYIYIYIYIFRERGGNQVNSIRHQGSTLVIKVKKERCCTGS